MTDSEPDDGVTERIRSDRDSISAPQAGLPSARSEEDREARMVVRIEQRLLAVIRRESRDPYGGLPADDVLDRLDRRFPEIGIPERMMTRLENEQDHRHAIARRAQETEQFTAETDRIALQLDDKSRREVGRRAVGVFVFLVIVGVALLVAGYEGAGELILGTTVIGVVAAFLAQQLRGK